MRSLSAGMLLCTLVIVSSCATKRQSGLSTSNVEAISQKDYEKSLALADSLWAKRHDRKSLESSINEMEKVANTDKATITLLTQLTRAYYLLGDAHEQEMNKKKTFWEKGAMWGERAMAMNADFKKAVVDQKEPMSDHFDKLTKQEAPAMYWTAANLGKWSKATGIAATLKNKPVIMGLIKGVESKLPQYFFGAVERYWGSFYAVAPGFAGGDMNKSWDKFQSSLKVAPHYLGTKVLLAELYYTKKGEKENFERILKEVLATADNIQPDLLPENILEKRKAEKLLKQIDELF